MEVIDKGKCELKSSLLEAHGYKRAISELKHAWINVVEQVTGTHRQILYHCRLHIIQPTFIQFYKNLKAKTQSLIQFIFI